MNSRGAADEKHETTPIQVGARPAVRTRLSLCDTALRINLLIDG